MPSPDLLPGVTSTVALPSVVCDSARDIRRARRLALIRDAAQLVLIAAVDAFFVHWPAAHVPGIGRVTSSTIVVLLNAALLAHVWLTRAFPRWSARRIAATWCAAERSRFFGDAERVRLQQPRGR